MPFFLIKGTFHVKGYAPDGDSVRFKADQFENWTKLSGPTVKANAQQHVQLRFEAIDTLETHYNNLHQPLEFADKATDFLTEQLRITNVVWDPPHTTITRANDGTRGYLLARTVEQNRRPVAFVYSGDSTQPDGAEVFLNVDLLKRSVNYRVLEQGLAYPTYYTGLFPDLRRAMTAAVVQARSNDAGFWSHDKTTAGFRVDTLHNLMNATVILPKLFRRVADFIGTGGSISGFRDFLALDPDPLVILDSGHFTNLDTIVEVEGDLVRLIEPPENLVFLPKP